MMDGRVGFIRDALDDAGFTDTGNPGLQRQVRVGVLRSVSATPSTRRPSTATRRATRWTRPIAARRCARCCSDLDEGADMVMVKPALPYLDVIAAGQAGVDGAGGGVPE